MKKILTALVTPFFENKIDYLSLEKLVVDQLKNGIHGFVVAGTTGEGSGLSAIERIELLNWVRKNVPSKTEILVGTGTSSYLQTLEDSLQAQDAGALALLIVVPPYVKPPQRGLVQYYQKLAASLRVPIYLYNVPGRTITGLQADSIITLSKTPGIAGIKEASGDISFFRKFKDQIQNPDFKFYSGDDATYEEFLEAGGHGIISVASHILPAQFVQGKIKNHVQLINGLFVEANPIPVKMALFLKGIIRSPELRLPLAAMDPNLLPGLKKLLEIKI